MNRNNGIKKSIVSKHRTVSGNWKTQLGYYAMILIPVLWIALTKYVTMFGVYMAFIDYKPAKGILGSKFVGLKYFKEFFSSIDFVKVVSNTLLYNFGNLILVSLLGGMFLALLLYEIKSKKMNKLYQTCMLLPSFLSWTVVSVALMTVLNPDRGVLNKVLEIVGMESVNWYVEAGYWPAIILVTMFIKGAGMCSIYFYSSLLAIDTELFDAANIDGASRIKQIRYISLPAMTKVFCITLIGGIGNILESGISPQYELTFNNGALYDTTLTLGIYQLNGLTGGRYAFTTAVGLVQSLVGLVLVLVTNGIVNRVDPESAMF